MRIWKWPYSQILLHNILSPPFPEYKKCIYSLPGQKGLSRSPVYSTGSHLYRTRHIHTPLHEERDGRKPSNVQKAMLPWRRFQAPSNLWNCEYPSQEVMYPGYHPVFPYGQQPCIFSFRKYTKARKQSCYYRQKIPEKDRYKQFPVSSTDWWILLCWKKR